MLPLHNLNHLLYIYYYYFLFFLFYYYYYYLTSFASLCPLPNHAFELSSKSYLSSSICWRHCMYLIRLSIVSTWSMFWHSLSTQGWASCRCWKTQVHVSTVLSHDFVTGRWSRIGCSPDLGPWRGPSVSSAGSSSLLGPLLQHRAQRTLSEAKNWKPTAPWRETRFCHWRDTISVDSVLSVSLC